MTPPPPQDEAPFTLRDGRVQTRLGVTRTEGPLQLPYNWDRRHPRHAGEAVFTLPFHIDALPATPWGLFIARAGTAFEVRLNGHLLQTFGSLDEPGGADYAKQPVYMAVPAPLLQPGDNALEVRIRADAGRRAGLSPVVLGPASVVQGDLYDDHYAWRYTATALLTAFSLVVGAIAWALWATQADATGRVRSERLYFWAGVAECCWALRMADGLIVDPPFDWSVWALLMASCYAVWAAAAMMFCAQLAGWTRGPVWRGLRWVVASVVVGTTSGAALSFSLDQPAWLTGWLAIEIVMLVCFVGTFAIGTLRQPEPARILTSLAALVTVALGARDYLVIRISESYGDTTWVRYSSVFFGLSLLVIVLERFRRASAEARMTMATLAQRVATREQELAAMYARLEVSARDQARTHERERILRDMHDGVGAHISAAIRQLQSGRSSADELLRTLRDSLDQLKLSIDAMQLPPGDVQALLAGMRYRLEPRLSSAGIRLEWAVDELPDWPALDAQGMRQLQFLLFEAISNVLQHAHADTLRLEAAQGPDGLAISVIDDGCGFDAESAPRSLARRAAALRARLTVCSLPGRTEVRLVLS